MKTSSYYFVILSLLTIPTLTSCEKPNVIEDPDLLKSLYDNSFDTLKIETSEYILETDLSRNLMHGGPIQEKRPLVALIYLVNMDSLPIPTEINITKLYVVKDQLIWKSTPTDSNQSNVPNFKIGKKSTGGPEWETDIYVDVVVEVFNNSTKNKYLIIVRHQYINALY
jgi:hypothetical protein